MLRYLCLVLLIWQVCCEDEPADIDPIEDELEEDLGYQDFNETDAYSVPQPSLIQVRASAKSYSLNFAHVNWHTARELCASQNQVLASVKNAQESDALLTAMLQYGVYNANNWFWLGGSQLGHIGQWSWVSTGMPISQIDWEIGAQWNSYCLEISSRGQWNGNDCDLKRPFICEDPPACS